MKFLFIIQGEGRGHLTQAIALAEMLENNGHTIAGALIGSRNGQKAPQFFAEHFNHTIIPFASPCLVYCKKTKALNITKTITNSFLKVGKYFKSLNHIQKSIQELNPDIIINFYDILGGIHHFLFRPVAPMVCIAHQYLLLHPDFKHPEKQWLDKCLVNINTKITALGAAKKLALSFTPFPNHQKDNIYTLPPLLRSEILSLKTASKDYILVYLTQHSLADELIQWHSKNPRVKIHCFWDKPQDNEVYQYAPNLYFHKINGNKFLEMMQNCQGLVTTAGFESVCEAMYLGKPTLMVPVPKHYEQSCNALDAKRAGAGITNTTFDLSEFIHYLPTHKDTRDEFQSWHNRSTFIFLREIEALFETNEQIAVQTLPSLTLTSN